ncbi:translocation/assembly module TamB domain-containing protein [Pseudovibrio exalbescens]|uniref:translocation/assembly module TamB domain-containing protein n=1 Tax=Pseudovibrio exalbescens TaxID=197461 RepID=UPI000C99B75A|nr:translocation/assembly module TamB domain-containing protein [Pseudovibrio exalbescens]
MLLRILGVITRLILSVIALVALAYGALVATSQFDQGREALGRVASALVPDIALSQLGISPTGTISVGRVDISDPTGPWLVVDGIILEWSPLALLRADLQIQQLASEHVRILRQPVYPAENTSEATEPADEGSGGLPRLTGRLTKLSIDKISIERPVLGTPIQLQVVGSADVTASPQAASVTLQAERLDSVQGRVDVAAHVDLADVAFDVDAKISEAAGGLVASLLDIARAPSFDAELVGSGTLEAFEAQLSVALDGKQTVSGSAALTDIAATKRLTADLRGDLETILPAPLKPLFAGNTQLVANGELDSSYFPALLDVSLATDTFFLKANSSVARATQTALVKVNIGTRLPSGETLELPVPDVPVSVQALNANLTAEGALDALDWTMYVEGTSIVSDQVDLQSVRLNARGTGASTLATALSTPLEANLVLEGVALKHNSFGGSMPPAASVSLKGDLDLTNQVARLDFLTAASDDTSLNLSNIVASPTRVSAQGQLEATNLSRFARLTDRPLAGAAAMTFSLDGTPDTGRYSLTFDSSADDLQTGIAQLDALTKGRATLSGSARGQLPADFPASGEIEVMDLKAASSRFDLEASGTLQDGAVDGSVRARLKDLAALDQRISGAVTLSSQVSGPLDAAVMSLEAQAERLEMMGTPVTDLSLRSEATLSTQAPRAQVNLSGSLRDREITVSGELNSGDGGADISDLAIVVGDNRANGAFTIADLTTLPEGIEGHLDISAPDLAQIAPLVLAEVEGSLVGRVQVQQAAGQTRVDLDAQASAFAWENVTLTSLSADARVLNAFSTPEVDGNLRLSELNAGAFVVTNANASAQTRGNTTTVDLQAKLDGDTDRFQTAFVVTRGSDALTIDINQISGSYQGITSQLDAPGQVVVRQGVVSLANPLVMALGDGRITVTGASGSELDLGIKVDAVPLNLANAFAPQLGLGGAVSASASVTGAPQSPNAQWQVNASGIAVAAMRDNAISPLTITSTGQLQNQRIQQDTRVTNNGGLDVTSTGTVSLSDGGTLNLEAAGQVPLEVLRARLIRAGLSGQGLLSVSGTAAGSFANPRFNVSVTPQNVELTRLATGLTLQNFRGSVDANQDRISVNDITADIRTGGTVRAGGTVGLGDGLPISVQAQVDQGRYVQGTLANVLLDADIRMTGPLASTAQNPTLAGTVTIERADIGIPNSFGGGVNPVIVRHLNAPKPVLDQARALAIDEGQASGASQQAETNTGAINLDLTVNAPGRVFVRGRGLNAEVGGSLRLAGTSRDVQGIGGFDLVRGRFDILSKRLEFQEGSVTFDGSLMPYIDFAATTSTANANVTIGVRGEADQPEITLTSSPDLPQDEILAQLLFGQSVTDLSPVQVAQLANAVTTLAGGGTGGPLGALRNVLGLSDIDVNVNADGAAELSAGTYINDNIYLGVTQNAKDGSNSATVDIEVTKDLKIRGEAGSTGDAKAGFFFEREY